MAIKDKVVIITGASSGLGEATARHLASQGAKLVLGARRTERLDQIVKIFNPGEAIETTDVTRREDLERLVQKAITHFGRVDVLVNNAGLMASAPMSKLKVDGVGPDDRH